MDPTPTKTPRPKRSRLEMIYDREGLSGIVHRYVEAREEAGMGQTAAVAHALQARSDSAVGLWRERAAKGEEPFREVFDAIADVDYNDRRTEMPDIMSRLKESNLTEYIRRRYPLDEAKRIEEFRRVMKDSAVIEHVQNVLSEMAASFEDNFPSRLPGFDPETAVGITRAAVDLMYEFLESFACSKGLGGVVSDAGDEGYES